MYLIKKEPKIAGKNDPKLLIFINFGISLTNIALDMLLHDMKHKQPRKRELNMSFD